jgi:hypothetical protein
MALPSAVPILKAMVELAYPNAAMTQEWGAHKALTAALAVVELVEAETKRQVNIVAPELLTSPA